MHFIWHNRSVYETKFHFIPLNLYAMITGCDDPNVFWTATRNWGGSDRKKRELETSLHFWTTRFFIIQEFWLLRSHFGAIQQNVRQVGDAMHGLHFVQPKYPGPWGKPTKLIGRPSVPTSQVSTMPKFGDINYIRSMTSGQWLAGLSKILHNWLYHSVSF